MTASSSCQGAAFAPQAIDGLEALWSQTHGDPEICIAVLDGPVDQTHPCFQGAKLQRIDTIATERAGTGRMSAHGTHVTSVIFAQPGSSVNGLAPACRGLIVPVFRDGEGGGALQLDLARAIEQAVYAGAHVINISGGERSVTGQPDPLLARALDVCASRGVLVVAAAGNDACDCVCVPAATASVLAVGAMDDDGAPLEISNWGREYQHHGILAPGKSILGAEPGGRTVCRTGTSFAVPIVSGIAGLLLSIQRQRRETPDPRAVGRALLQSASPCTVSTGDDARRCLAGVLNLAGASSQLTHANESGECMTIPRDEGQPGLVNHTPAASGAQADVERDGSSQSTIASGNAPISPDIQTIDIPRETETILAGESLPASTAAVDHGAENTGVDSATSRMPIMAADSGCTCRSTTSSSYVFTIGTIGYDFRSEARRDSFRQLMPTNDGRPASPFATDQMVQYLGENPSESTKLTWTLNLDLTPIYAIEGELPYAHEIYEFFRIALAGQIEPEDSEKHIARVSVPGVLTGRTVRLFSGQVVPVVVVQNRGLWGWNVNTLIDNVVARFDVKQRELARISMRNFLDKVYYELRNLGQSPADRALNFSATNAFQAGEAIVSALYPKELVNKAGLYMLDAIDAVRSPFCRMDSDCWDVKLSFFDPENDRRARIVMRFTVDVSDAFPVTLGPVRHWTVAGA